MRLRLTIEYDIQPDHTKADEMRDWLEGNITYQDLQSLMDDGDEDIMITFQAID